MTAMGTAAPAAKAGSEGNRNNGQMSNFIEVQIVILQLRSAVHILPVISVPPPGVSLHNFE